MASFAQGALVEQFTTQATSGGILVLTKNSKTDIVLSGSANHTVQLPSASTVKKGRRFRIANESTGTLTIRYDDTSILTTIGPGVKKVFELLDNNTNNGVWQIEASYVKEPAITQPFDQLYSSAPSSITHGMPGVPSMVFLWHENNSGEWIPLEHYSYVVKITSSVVEFDWGSLGSAINPANKLRVVLFHTFGTYTP